MYLELLVILLGLLTFDDTSSLGYPLHYVVYHPLSSILVTAFHFLEGEREVDLKPTTLYSFLLFCIFLLLFIF